MLDISFWLKIYIIFFYLFWIENFCIYMGVYYVPFLFILFFI